MGNSGDNSESQNADRNVDNKDENKVSLGELDYRPFLIPAKTLYLSSIQSLCMRPNLKVQTYIQQGAFQGSLAWLLLAAFSQIYSKNCYQKQSVGI